MSRIGADGIIYTEACRISEPDRDPCQDRPNHTRQPSIKDDRHGPAEGYFRAHSKVESDPKDQDGDQNGKHDKQGAEVSTPFGDGDGKGQHAALLLRTRLLILLVV